MSECPAKGWLWRGCARVVLCAVVLPEAMRGRVDGMTDIASLENVPCVVIAMRPPGPDPTLIVGSNPQSPLGIAVCIGASATIGGSGLALVAHMAPAAALEVAAKIREHALAMLALESGGGRA